MRCKICNNEFIPSKYRPKQETCSQAACQRRRQIQNLTEWRIRIPDYFKCLGQENSWRENRHRYTQLWKATHKDYIKVYEKEHKQERNDYMREYMRRYREAKVAQFTPHQGPSGAELTPKEQSPS